MSGQNRQSGNSIDWLLEVENIGVRYLTLRDLLALPAGSAEMKTARKLAHRQGPIAAVLSKMDPQGFWFKPGTGYSPKYRSTVWSVILLAQLGAQVSEDKRIAQACRYLLDHSLTSGGQFCALASLTPSGTIDCLQGNLCWALTELGCDDPRLSRAFEWMARSVTGEGVAPKEEKDAPVRYYAYKCGPTFACGANSKQSCAWGGVKVLLAFANLPQEMHSALIKRAIKQGVEFFLSVDPATAAYPNGRYFNPETALSVRDKPNVDKPNRNWWKFGFPVFYITDLLQLAEALVGLGYARDKRLEYLLHLIHAKQDGDGRWPLEYEYRTWVDFGLKGRPNKWVTLRALKVLEAAGAPILH